MRSGAKKKKKELDKDEEKVQRAGVEKCCLRDRVESVGRQRRAIEHLPPKPYCLFWTVAESDRVTSSF
jgi:hypothetical protein